MSPVVDAHTHAWRVWPYREVPDPYTRGSAATLVDEMDRAGVDRAVVMAARIGSGPLANPDNNAYVVQAARDHPDRIVAAIDVDSRWLETHHRPGAVDRLDAELAGTGARVVSHYTRDDHDDGWFDSSDGRAFVVELERRGLVLSLHAYPAWQPAIRRFAESAPGLPVLVHHLGHPQSQHDLDAVTAGAVLPNVHVKVSGPYYLPGPRWGFPYPRALDVVRALRDAYGPERLLWGSDFPVARPHMTYRQSVEFVRTKCTFLSAEELDLVLGGNAHRILAGR